MSPVIDVSIKKTVLYNFAINMNRHKNNYFLNMNGSRITSSSIFQSLISDHVLFDHVMNESTVADGFECHQKCLRNNTCKSFNVRPGADIAKRLCELNNKTRKMTQESFKKMKGSSYYGPVKVSSTD